MYYPSLPGFPHPSPPEYPQNPPSALPMLRQRSVPSPRPPFSSWIRHRCQPSRPSVMDLLFLLSAQHIVHIDEGSPSRRSRSPAPVSLAGFGSPPRFSTLLEEQLSGKGMARRMNAQAVSRSSQSEHTLSCGRGSQDARDGLRRAVNITDESFRALMSRVQPSVPAETQAQCRSLEQRGL